MKAFITFRKPNLFKELLLYIWLKYFLDKCIEILNLKNLSDLMLSDHELSIIYNLKSIDKCIDKRFIIYLIWYFFP